MLAAIDGRHTSGKLAGEQSTVCYMVCRLNLWKRVCTRRNDQLTTFSPSIQAVSNVTVQEDMAYIRSHVILSQESQRLSSIYTKRGGIAVRCEICLN